MKKGNARPCRRRIQRPSPLDVIQKGVCVCTVLNMDVRENGR
jgi:hypothetical protein